MEDDALPVIDFQDPSAAQKIFQACVSAGFFYLKNHGLGDEYTQSLFTHAQRWGF